MGKDRRCSCCGESGHDRRSCDQSIGLVRNSRSRSFDPWHDLEFYEDSDVQEIIKKHPDGMTLEQVGEVIGVTRERVRQIEVIALHKIKTGEGAGQVIEVDGEPFAVAFCEDCGQPFPRRGRKKLCPDCDESGLTFIRVEAVFGIGAQSLEIAARTGASSSTNASHHRRKKRSQDPAKRMEKVMSEFFTFFEVTPKKK